jgi:ABC-2 type transport system permease protein
VSALASQATVELRLAMRQGEQLLVSLGIPLGVLVFFSTVDVLPMPDGVTQPVDLLAPGVLALAVMSTAMVSLGIGTGFDRNYHVLKRLGSTPLGRGRWVLAKLAMVLAVELVQLAVLVPTALALGWHPGVGLLLVIPAALLGTAAFAGIGLLLAGMLPATVNLAVTNGLYLVLLMLGGMVIPLSELPDVLAAAARLLPGAALAGTMVAATTDAVEVPVAAAWGVLAVWAVAAPVAATRWFRWD